MSTAPIGGPYGDAATMKRRGQIPDTNTTRDEDITAALKSAASAIHRYTGRQFGRTDTASERTFTGGRSGVNVDDFWTTDGLLINGTAWVGGEAYELEGGIRDGVPGWPYFRLATPWMAHPIYATSWASKITVTAKWGWEAIPDDVVEASYLLAADSLRSGDAPFGIAGFGDYVVRVRANPKVAEKLSPYVRELAKVA